MDDHPPKHHRQSLFITNEAAKPLEPAMRTLDRFRAAREGLPWCKFQNRVRCAHTGLPTSPWRQGVNIG